MRNSDAMNALLCAVIDGNATTGIVVDAFVSDNSGDKACLAIALNVLHAYTGSIDSAIRCAETMTPSYIWALNKSSGASLLDSPYPVHHILTADGQTRPARELLAHVIATYLGDLDRHERMYGGFVNTVGTPKIST